MQVPERLALIGGSILLASTLIFTLKSQASNIIPKVGDSVGTVYQGITDTQAQHGALSFNDAFKNAQKQGWTTGTWGSSKYYINKDMDLHIGGGRLDGTLYNTIGDQAAHSIRTINLDENVQAPGDSSDLFTGRNNYKNTSIDPSAATNKDTNNSITAINGLDKLDVSQVTNMNNMFYRDAKLSGNWDLNNWNTSQVQDMTGMFGATQLQNLNIKNWDVRQNTGTGWMFLNDTAMTNIDLSGWHTDSLNNAPDMFGGDNNLQSLHLDNFNTKNTGMDYFFGGQWQSTPDNLNNLTLGNGVYLKNTIGLKGDWKNTTSGQVLSSSQLMDENNHAGNWIKQ